MTSNLSRQDWKTTVLPLTPQTRALNPLSPCALLCFPGKRLKKTYPFFCNKAATCRAHSPEQLSRSNCSLLEGTVLPISPSSSQPRHQSDSPRTSLKAVDSFPRVIQASWLTEDLGDPQRSLPTNIIPWVLHQGTTRSTELEIRQKRSLFLSLLESSALRGALMSCPVHLCSFYTLTGTGSPLPRAPGQRADSKSCWSSWWWAQAPLEWHSLAGRAAWLLELPPSRSI